MLDDIDELQARAFNPEILAKLAALGPNSLVCVSKGDPDPAKRARRLALLGRIRAAVHQVADFSRIEN